MDWLESLKGYLTGMLGRWLLKIGGGVLLALGYEANEWEVITAGIASIVVGAIISIAQHKLAKKSDPTTPGTEPTPAPKAAPRPVD